MSDSIDLQLEDNMKCPSCEEELEGKAEEWVIQGWNAGALSNPEECWHCETMFTTRLDEDNIVVVEVDEEI